MISTVTEWDEVALTARFGHDIQSSFRVISSADSFSAKVVSPTTTQVVWSWAFVTSESLLVRLIQRILKTFARNKLVAFFQKDVEEILNEAEKRFRETGVAPSTSITP